MDQAYEHITAADVPPGLHNHPGVPRSLRGWEQPERSVRPVGVVMLDVGVEDPVRDGEGRRSADDRDTHDGPSRSNAPRNAFAFGARTAVRMIWAPMKRHTSSNGRVNLVSRSRIG